MTLPDSRTFYAKYKRVSRKELPYNVTIKRSYRRRIGQWGHGFGKIFKKGFSFAKKVSRSRIRKDLANSIKKESIKQKIKDWKKLNIGREYLCNKLE